MFAIGLRRDPGELRVRVVHVEDFVAQDLLEDFPRGRIVVDDVPVDLEAARCGLFRDVQKGEQPMIRLAVDAQVVEAMVPLANMFGYVNELRSFTQGRAQYTMQFSHYDEVPANVAQEVKEKLA